MNKILFSSLLILFACGMKKKSTTDEVIIPTDEQKEMQKETYPEVEIGKFSAKNDPYTINSVKIEGNFMVFDVSYSGGCQQHGFKLIGSPMKTKSIPPIRTIQLVHDANGDMCEQWKTEKVKFAISILADHYNKGNLIKLQLENYEPEMSYSYE